MRLCAWSMECCLPLLLDGKPPNFGVCVHSSFSHPFRMCLQMLMHIVIFCIFVFLAISCSGANIKNGLKDANITIPKDITIENLELNRNDRRKTTREPITMTLTTTPPTPSSSGTTLYRLNGNNGMACILIRTDGLLSFNYVTTTGEKREGDVFMPDNYDSTGNCDNEDDAYITISWKSYQWSVYFSKTPGGEHWYVSKMELIVKSDEKVFEHIKGAPLTFRFKTAKERSMLFPTPVGKAFTCSDESTVTMSDRGVTANVLLRDLKMQPFIFKKDDFGPEYICTPGGAKSYRDETAPIAVGSTLAIVTLLTVTGYGVYRYMKIKKVQYDTME